MTSPTTIPRDEVLYAPVRMVLIAAAGMLALHGLHPAFHRHGVLVREYWPDDRAQPWRPGLPLSVVGAIAVALGYRRSGDVQLHVIPGLWVDGAPADPAVLALALHVGRGSVDELLAWQDRTSGAEIVATMRACAAEQVRAVAA